MDHGVGIDPEHLESIFNPFFTTKPQGVGLGLALVSKIVDEHGGKISVRSDKGAGTTFEVSLPKEQPTGIMTSERILIVEDEDKLRRVLQLQLESLGYEVEEASTAEQGLACSGKRRLIVTDLRLPGMDGIAFIKQLQAQGIQAPVIVMTAHGSVEVAVEAMKLGAADFLQKPFSLDHLSAIVQKVMAMQSLRDENQRLREQLDTRYQFDNVIGRSAAMREIFHTVERVAPTRATVLLAGESGVGKDMIARAIHQHSPRRTKPFVKINCTALPENLMESELFGYEKGAFTGATVSKPGKFEQADGGTVFLDEIGDVPANIQVKLLRVLQEREFERLGSNFTRNVDLRIVAATNVDLREALEQGRFREDLYYRLNVVPINVPPLRDRKEDIPFLAMHFLQKHAKDLGIASDGDQPGGAGSTGSTLVARECSRTREHDRAEPGSGIERSVATGGYPHRGAKAQSFPAHTAFTFVTGRRNAGTLGTDDDPGGFATCKWKQEPGGSHAGPYAQRLPLSAFADGIGRRRE